MTMRIAILTTGRFHLCDLARELNALGHDVAFYSIVPPWRTRRFGLPARCNRWLGPVVAPVLAVARALRVLGRPVDFSRWIAEALDVAASRAIQRCDVLIALSGVCGRTIEAVRKRYGARVFLERGSMHVLAQRAILAPLVCRGGSAVPSWAVAHELEEYEQADVIVVPSRHVLASFRAYGVAAHRLFLNPYGVDLAMFPPTPAPADRPPTVIMVGTWSLRKGCDILTEAWRQMRGTALEHVGDVGDAPMPADEGFRHWDSVDQTRLTFRYAQAHVLALPSREDGLSLVMAQALASGLPVVATERTGALDLQEMISDPQLVTVLPCHDVSGLTDALSQALERVHGLRGLRDLLGPGRERLSWAAYGARYAATLAEKGLHEPVAR